MKIKESFAASSDPLTSHRPFHGRQTRPRQARRLSKSRGAEILDMKREVMRVNQLTQAIIGAAIEVHRTLGPGLLERAYKTCLCRELQLQQLPFERQKPLPVTYKGLTLSVSYQLDMVVDGGCPGRCRRDQSGLTTAPNPRRPTADLSENG